MVQVEVAEHTEEFAPQQLDTAIYGTGWDGTTIVELTTDGKIEVTTAGSGPPPKVAARPSN